MKPYFEQDGIAIYHGDCRDILNLLAFDVVITDPPYGIGLANHDAGGKRRSASFDIVGDHSTEAGSWIVQYCEVCNVPLICFASPEQTWPGEWRQHLVWDKGPAVGGGGDVATCWKFTHEVIQVARTGKLNGPRDESVLRSWPMSPTDSKLHPAQKPVGLMKYLIHRSTALGNVVADPFMGSGSTLRAAKDAGRRAVGIEIEERYCEMAARRLEQAVLPFAG